MDRLDKAIIPLIGFLFVLWVFCVFMVAAGNASYRQKCIEMGGLPDTSLTYTNTCALPNKGTK